jgi:hypothetical protein
MGHRNRAFAVGILVWFGACAVEDTDEPRAVSRSALEQTIRSETEPNDSFDSAASLAGSTGWIRASLLAPDDTDVYALHADAGNSIHLSTVTVLSSSGLDVHLQLFSPSGALLASDTGDGTRGDSTNVGAAIGAAAIAGATAAETGMHRVVVTRPPNGTSVRPYDLFYLVTDGTVVAEAEPNETATTGQILESGDEVVASQLVQGDKDFFRVFLNEGDLLYASLDSEVVIQGTITVYAPDGSFHSGYANWINPTVPYATPAAFRAFDTGYYSLEADASEYKLAVSVIPPVRGTCHSYTNSTNVPVSGASAAISTIDVQEEFEVDTLRVSHNFTTNIATASLLLERDGANAAAPRIPGALALGLLGALCVQRRARKRRQPGLASG